MTSRTLARYVGRPLDRYVGRRVVVVRPLVRLYFLLLIGNAIERSREGEGERARAHERVGEREKVEEEKRERHA